MTPRIYRALSVVCFLLAATIYALNLRRTMNLGWKTIPLYFFIIGLFMIIRAKKAQRINSGS